MRATKLRSRSGSGSVFRSLDPKELRHAHAPHHPISPSSAPRSPSASASPTRGERRRLRAGVPRRTSPTLRWPGGVECPRCTRDARACSGSRRRSKWHCYACRYQFSVTAGTLFHSSHLPVWKWFVAVHLMLDSPEGVSANELRRTLGGSYKTAWFAAHRIRAAMRGHGAELLRSLVEAELREAGAASPPEPGRARPRERHRRSRACAGSSAARTTS